MTVKEIHLKYDPGTAKEKEDGYGIYGSFFFVIDAFSEPYSKEYPKTYIDGYSLGEHTARLAESFFKEKSSFLERWPVSALFSKLNKAVLSEKEKKGISKETIELSGTSFAAANVGQDNTEILAAGDSFAAIELKSGKTLITKNQVHLHDSVMHKEISRLMEEVSEEWNLKLDSVDKKSLEEIRKEMWNRFCPILKTARKKTMNNPEIIQGYPTLNGNSQGEIMWQRFFLPTVDIKRLLLFTDGVVAWEMLKKFTQKQLSTFVIEFYKKAGLDGLLDLARSMEAATSEKSYTAHAEATVIAIESN